MKDRRILHVGCGGNPLPEWLTGIEVRLDINDEHNPDILASMTDMGAIGTFEVIYCAHALEHLTVHEGQTALKEFKRVLATNGFVLIVVPDLQDVRPTNDIMYESLSGPITGIDMYYGYGKMLVDNPEMGHKNGFVKDTLQSFMQQAGFNNVYTKRLPEFNLMSVGY